MRSGRMNESHVIATIHWNIEFSKIWYHFILFIYIHVIYVINSYGTRIDHVQGC